MNKSRFLSYFSLYLPSSTRYGIGGYNEVGGCGGQCQCQSGITNVAKITKSYYEGHGGVILRECITVKCQENIYCCSKTDSEVDDWTSDGREFQRMAAATGNERRPVDTRRCAGTCGSKT